MCNLINDKAGKHLISFLFQNHYREFLLSFEIYFKLFKETKNNLSLLYRGGGKWLKVTFQTKIPDRFDGGKRGPVMQTRGARTPIEAFISYVHNEWL